MKNAWKTRRLGPNGTSEEPSRPVDPEKARVRTLQFAVKLLAAKHRSVAELRQRLEEKSWASKDIIERVISQLVEYRYLDDEKFATSFASHRIRQRPIGRLRLRRDLEQKGVDHEISGKVLNLLYEDNPEEQLIDRAIEKRTRLRGVPTSRAETKSLVDHLLRQGFPMDLIWEKVNRLNKCAVTDCN